MSASRRVKRAMLEAVENQLCSNHPPETRQTLERLLLAGYSHQQAMEHIAGALAEEIWFVLHEHEQYNAQRYKAVLENIKS